MKPCGYVNCTCRDCMDVAVCSRPVGEKHEAAHHLCNECGEAGCDASGNSECAREDLNDGEEN